MIRQLLLYFLLIQITLVAARGKGRGGGGGGGGGGGIPPPTKKWLTLSGAEPKVVARGGFSGVVPESSEVAYNLAVQTASDSTILLCDLQFTKDLQAFCLSSVNLENATTITQSFPDVKPKTYNLNGKDVTGYFGVDFTLDDLQKNVALVQSIFSRSPSFDGAFLLYAPYELTTVKGSLSLWLNVEYPSFYDGLKISPSSYVLDTLPDLAPSAISSPEVAFLKAVSTTVDKALTKIYLKVTNLTDIEPTTKQTYAALLKDVKTIKTYASGVVLPKDSIWPVNAARILQPATSLVTDLHKEGLEVFASGFANDNFLSYNYSYDPTREYLQFVDNSQFSVDGVITDFPATGAEAIVCLAQNQNASRVTKTLIITHDGASGDYPGSTDLAYQKAIDDGADIIDCSVQMSKDGTAFCLPSVDLTGTTTATSLFLDRSTKIPEVQEKNGIFSFDLTWSEIQSLKPQVMSVFDGGLVRNPENKNAGKFVTLAEFLDLAKTKAVPGVLINIQNAAYLASNKGLDIVVAVTTALSNATFDKQATQKVLIQSDDSSVLLKFQDVKSYQKVLTIDDDISGATKQTADEVKKYADAIRVFRNSIVLDYPSPVFMSLGFSNLVDVMHADNISVYVGVLRNEYQNFLFDYYADPYVELATLTQKGVDGVTTDYPATASAYMKSPCSNPNAKGFSILPITPGDMFTQLVTAKPPEAAPPVPLLDTADIVDPPLPPVTKITDTATPGSPSSGSNSSNSSLPAEAPKSSSSTIASNTIFTISVMAVVLALLGSSIKY
ncbi:OLC1v1035623C1 [Oldenlandia corymbosa var. corymbosa]|uniref:glycerophosphodiester phosphodiesterase n=1 Tax=Oldenlandia corymbosa var. corymbosa TaxID=529605 RepID=A0AAV1CWJ4_OLDCO|nr:OLC1v1035623C1 [Oldenlandia corymbosa var. corymbosa]